MSGDPHDPDYGLGRPEPADDDAAFDAELKKFDQSGDYIVELPYGVRPPNQVLLRYVRRGDVLELAFEVNGYRVASFRFQGT